MKKNILLLITPLVLSLVLSSCFRDDTTLGDNIVSEITIGSDSDIINTEVKEELVFTPEVSQSIEGTELNYEWALGEYATENYPVGDTLILISNEPVLRYEFNTLGAYTLRLKVSNENFAEFKFFRLNVNSPYEEGIIVLSENESGVADISFMKTLTPEEVAEGKTPVFLTNLFSAINPTYQINSAVDMEKIQNQIVVASKEKGRLYKIDHKTFDLISVHEAELDFPGIVLASIEPFDAVGSSSYTNNAKNFLFAEDGNVYGYDPFTDIVFETKFFSGTKFEKTYTKRRVTVHSSGIVGINVYPYAVDYDLSQIVTTNYSSRRYDSGTLFSNYDIVNLVVNNSPTLFTISTEKADPTQIHITKTKYHFFTPDDYTYQDANLTLTRDAKMVITDVHNKVYYNSGNDIYQWNYVSGLELPSTPAFTIDAGLEVTCIEMSANGEELYVGVYNPAAPGLKGSVYVYNADDASLINKYEGVADKPIRVFYKEK